MKHALGSYLRAAALSIAHLVTAHGVAHPATGFAQSRTPAWRSQLPAELAETLVEVPLVRDTNARATLVNVPSLMAAGVVTSALPTDDEAARAAEARFAWRAATEEEIREGRVEMIAVATRYHDARDGQTWGAVRGDGRAVIVSDVLLLDARTREVRGLYQIQSKGIGTGLRPVGVLPTEGHGTGRERMTSAIYDAVVSSYSEANGVETTGWLAVLDTNFLEVMNPEGRPDVVHRDPAATFIRTGTMIRLAHLRYLANDPLRLRQFIDVVNGNIMLRLGRRTPLTLRGVYSWMVQHAAERLADMYFARLMQGSATYDNLGLFETIDLPNSGVVDRTHATYSTGPGPGFGREPTQLLTVIAQELGTFMRTAAVSDAERRDLERLPVGRAAGRWLRGRLTRNLLQHLGFSDADVRRVMRARPGEVAQFAQAFFMLSKVEATGHTSRVGPAGAEREIQNPALYDMFAALGATTTALVEERPDAVEQLVAALAPYQPDAERDQTAARALLATARPLVEHALSHLRGRPRSARGLQLAGDARRINAPTTTMSTAHVWQLAIDAAWAGHENRLDVVRHRADVRVRVRENIRRGPRTPHAIADRIVRGDLERLPDGRLVLSRELENGVRIEEVSDGVHDAVRFTVARALIPSNSPEETIARYTYGSNDAWIDARPLEMHEGDEGLTFEIPITADPHDFVVGFVHLPSSTWVNNHSGGYARRALRLLGNPIVSAALAEHAHRNHLERSGVDRADRVAVRALAIGTRARRPPPRPRIRTVEEARARVARTRARPPLLRPGDTHRPRARAHPFSRRTGS